MSFLLICSNKFLGKIKIEFLVTDYLWPLLNISWLNSFSPVSRLNLRNPYMFSWTWLLRLWEDIEVPVWWMKWICCVWSSLVVFHWQMRCYFWLQKQGRLHSKRQCARFQGSSHIKWGLTWNILLKFRKCSWENWREVCMSEKLVLVSFFFRYSSLFWSLN